VAVPEWYGASGEVAPGEQSPSQQSEQPIPGQMIKRPSRESMICQRLWAEMLEVHQHKTPSRHDAFNPSRQLKLNRCFSGIAARGGGPSTQPVTCQEAGLIRTEDVRLGHGQRADID